METQPYLTIQKHSQIGGREEFTIQNKDKQSRKIRGKQKEKREDGKTYPNQDKLNPLTPDEAKLKHQHVSETGTDELQMRLNCSYFRFADDSSESSFDSNDCCKQSKNKVNTINPDKTSSENLNFSTRKKNRKMKKRHERLPIDDCKFCGSIHTRNTEYSSKQYTRQFSRNRKKSSDRTTQRKEGGSYPTGNGR